MHEAILFACEAGFQCTILESYSKEAVEIFKEKPLLTLKFLCCFMIFDLHFGCQCGIEEDVFVGRHANCVADKLARFAQTLQDVEVWLEDPPLC